VAPIIVHEPILEKRAANELIHISATVTDNAGVKEVLLFQKYSDEKDYVPLKMTSKSGSDIYTVTLKNVRPGKLEYFIQATDAAGNMVREGQKFSPLSFVISPVVTRIDNKHPDSQEPATSKWVWASVAVLTVGVGYFLLKDDDKKEKDATVIISTPLP
ncbi:MAG: hypothetical protein R3240_13835, partial [Gammaproteobacteria bacterium]|nr:hypothetical protein [Gammaproteobacteria bacterium]